MGIPIAGLFLLGKIRLKNRWWLGVALWLRKPPYIQLAEIRGTSWFRWRIASFLFGVKKTYVTLLPSNKHVAWYTPWFLPWCTMCLTFPDPVENHMANQYFLHGNDQLRVFLRILHQRPCALLSTPGGWRVPVNFPINSFERKVGWPCLPAKSRFSPSALGPQNCPVHPVVLQCSAWFQACYFTGNMGSGGVTIRQY